MVDYREPLDLHIYWKRTDKPFKVVRVYCDRDDHDTLTEHLLDVVRHDARLRKDRVGEFHMDVHRADRKRPEFAFKP